jgi:hypothetical protein
MCISEGDDAHVASYHSGVSECLCVRAREWLVGVFCAVFR